MQNSHDNFENLNTEVKLEVKDVDEETCTVINLKRSENESRTTLKSRQTESTGSNINWKTIQLRHYNFFFSVI